MAQFSGTTYSGMTGVGDQGVPVVAAGGPKAKNLRQALTAMADVVQAGGRGATIGRNIWGFANVTANIKAFKAVIHDGMSAEDALRKAGL